MESVTVTLQHPVEARGQSADRLTMRRPKVRDLLSAERQGKGDAEREIVLFASLCEVDPKIIEELDLADYGVLQETYRGFLS